MSSNKIMDDAEADDTECEACDKVDPPVITDKPRRRLNQRFNQRPNQHRRHSTPASRYEFTG